MRDLTITGVLTAPVNFIVHTLNDVNSQLERGRPFFIDIVEQGVALYEAEGFPFAQPRKLPPEEAFAEARAYFEKWFPSAVMFTQTADFAISKGGRNEAAFLLHQATERLYHSVLLTLTRLCCKTDVGDSRRESSGIDGRDAQTCRTCVSHDELA